MYFTKHLCTYFSNNFFILSTVQEVKSFLTSQSIGIKSILKTTITRLLTFSSLLIWSGRKTHRKDHFCVVPLFKPTNLEKTKNGWIIYTQCDRSCTYLNFNLPPNDNLLCTSIVIFSPKTNLYERGTLDILHIQT